MRIRSTRPEFWRSATIARLPWDVRLVLKGIESYVDDNGVGKDDIALIAADVFPRDLSGNPPETLRRLTEAVALLFQHGLIARYVIDGEELLYVDRWKDIQYIQKPAKGRFPRPDGTMDYREDVNPESYRSIPETLRTKAGEQGSRGAGEQDISLVPADSYERAHEDEGEREAHPKVDLDPTGVVVPASMSDYPMILIPDDWVPDDLTRAKHPRPDIEEQAEAFRDHAHAVGRRCHGPAGWNAAFSTWLRKNPPPGQGAATTKARGWLDLANAIDTNPPDPDQKAIR